MAVLWARHLEAAVLRQAVPARQAEKARSRAGSARPPVASAAFQAGSVRCPVAKVAFLVALVPRVMGLAELRARCYRVASQAAAPRCSVGWTELLLRVALP